MKIGQRVIINNGEDSQAFGVYAGTGVMQRFENGPMETMALIRLNPVDSGYIQPDGRGKKPISFVSSLVVHPSNITVIEE
jgi:hypothetical protein